ncbi:protein tyrosine phosphatase domain-containing protein 1 [Pygocentrus nattereri]|uniref:Protein tyrosine phosphatase domain-containing protein 1 n=1 Tax=Pygocentrus nattereri TaxID=42514 RepID=A0A3B4D1A8_PYGNA|nr:protein tyrosine phosphatase domain-containing protein 1 [Pygocentrus nattereri]XP_017553742.1 protein tyrosine phosphatase domain-containing protein 1 [Pygocentrus nattereri]
MESVRAMMATAKYTLVGETLRYVIPSHMQCSIGCGGRACKYEDPSRWSEDKQAIKGLYSSWITDNLLAMARPSTEIIEKYNIIEQFQKCGLRTVINLQRPGEHANCGNPLEPDSGFTYRPETFMEAGIYFYNFGWNDYGVASLTTVLDMVKVMCFAIQEGKMAVHCHAGLGRTGVLLACFLVFTSRMTAEQAILFVRSKRPNSIQTRGQLVCVRQFAQFLVPLRNLFAHAEPRASPVTLSQYLIRQKHILHGYEARQLRYMPKLVLLICKLLLDIADNRQVIEEDILEVPDVTSEDDSSGSFTPVPQFVHPIIAGGLTMIQPRLPGLPVNPRDASQPPLHYARKSISYSDSDLRRLADTLNLSGNPLAILASVTQANTVGKDAPQSNLLQQDSANPHGSLKDLATYGSCSSLWELKTMKDQKEGCALLNTRRQSVLQRSQSLGVSDHSEKRSSFAMLLAWKKDTKESGGCEETKNGQVNHTRDEESERLSEIPFITIQSELSLEARRLLVAQSLAVDLYKDGKEEHIQKVSEWQTDLNHQGAWERLCLERDPFVLTGILWSWLEQLKESIISPKDIQALDQPNPDPKTVLNSLNRAPREILTCILDCFAHLLVIPEEVENAFVERIIRAFTKIKNVSGGEDVYEIMTRVLKRVLRDMRSTAMEETQQL